MKSCVVVSCVISRMKCHHTRGIDQAVEFGGVAEPFHQSLRLSTYLTTLQYRFHVVHFIGGYRHLLQFHLVEGAIQHFAEIVPQSVHGWIGGMNLVYREHLFAPIHRVAFFELAFVLTDAHAIRHAQLGHTLTVVTVHTVPHLFLILWTYLPCRYCGGGCCCTIAPSPEERR